MKKKHRVLFISTCDSSFVKTDINILSDFYKMTILIGSGITLVIKIVFLLPFHSVIFCWFGTVYSAIAVIGSKILRKKIIIVLGGVDVAKIPELNYGIWMNPWKAKLLTFAYRNASQLLAVSPSFKGQVGRLANYPAENFHFLPTGYDTDFWKPDGSKEKLVLTVAHSGFNVTAEEAVRRFKIKGMDWLFTAALRLPDIRFIIIGFSSALLKKMCVDVPPNVEIIDYLPKDQLLNYYRKALVYCQPSLSEGLPNTICEAMACGCIPVGSDAGGIPEAIGDTGLIIQYGNTAELTDAIVNSINYSQEKGMLARNRIISRFSVSRRQNELLELIDKVRR